jgi:serine/threonine-protein kinase mTOR
MFKSLLPKTLDSDSGVSISIMMTLGELSQVGGKEIIPMIEPFMKVIVKTLQNSNFSEIEKRNSALHALGQLASSSGYVIQPYIDNKNLLGTLIHMLLNETNQITRREVVKVMGILGALDPYRHGIGEGFIADPSSSLESGLMQPLSIGPSHEDYYPTVTFSALLGILRDSSLAIHHAAVVEALMYIFRSLRLKCVNFLPQVIPAMISAMRNCNPQLYEHYFENLGQLIDVVRHHIRNHLKPIIELIQDFWNNISLQLIIVSLIESIAKALDSEFRSYLPSLLPLMLSSFEGEIRESNSMICVRILKTFIIFGSNLQQYLHLALPTIIKTFERADVSINLRISSIQMISTISKKINFSDQISRVIHPLIRVLDVQDLRAHSMKALCTLLAQIGPDFVLFVPTINKVSFQFQPYALHRPTCYFQAVLKNRINYPAYDALVNALINNEELPPGAYGDE